MKKEKEPFFREKWLFLMFGGHKVMLSYSYEGMALCRNRSDG